ncbi:PPK2 family polyphosphate kinase [Zhihengliuella salsuginis]|nr:PPK2 family polyphosphate kinase [Zhihengliuella salsuginis]
MRARRPVRLADVDPRDKTGYDGKKADGVKTLAAMDPVLSDLQERLFAASRHGAADRVLLIIQGMDTAGKGGIVRHVIGTVDPQGVHHHAFKAPSEEELEHDFLWRIENEIPGEGMIGVFDRSHYEDVLIHRVRGLSSTAEVEGRYAAIREFEEDLAGRGVKIVKVMLHISKDEQAGRLQERLDRPEKHWKFDPADIDGREMWDDYQRAYEIAIEETDADHAPWFVVPADRKWFARIAVQELLIEALQDIDPQWPAATFDVAEQKARLSAE